MGSGRGLGIALIMLAIAGGLVLWRQSGPEIGALGLFTLAAIAGIVATGRIGRRIIAVLLVPAAIVIAVLGFSMDVDGIVHVIAALIIVLVAAATWHFAGRWPGLSTRYGAVKLRPSDPWTELDAGRDPTT